MLSFADCLKRKLAGKSPESFAGEVPYSDRQLRKLFNGEALPASTKYPLWAEFLGMPVEELAALVDAERTNRNQADDTAPYPTVANVPADSTGAEQ